MTDGHFADQFMQLFPFKNLRNQSHALVLKKMRAIAGNNAGTFLAAMLQRVEAVVGELGGVGVAVHAKNTAVMLGVM